MGYAVLRMVILWRKREDTRKCFNYEEDTSKKL